MFNKHKMITQSKNRLNEEGIVSIVVTLIIMIVLTLIVTGFAQLARREQREALDRQLSAQASYAAESGINALKAALPDIEATSRKECNEPVEYTGSGTNPFVSTTLSDNSSYTCLLFNELPKELIYGSVGGDEAVIAPLSLQKNGVEVNLDSLNISWKAKDGSTSVYNGNLGVFPSDLIWGKSIGILRLDLIPIPNPGTDISSAGLDGSTQSFLLQPRASGGVQSLEGPLITNGSVIGVACSNSGCSLKITGLTLKKYYLRMRSIYTTSSVTLNSVPIPGASPLEEIGFTKSQIEIDSTGKATDVLKRIKVRIEYPDSINPIKSGPNFPEYVFSSNDNLCKRLSLTNIPTGNVCY